MIRCDSCDDHMVWISDISFQDYGLELEEWGAGIIQEFDCKNPECLTFRYLVYRRVKNE